MEEEVPASPKWEGKAHVNLPNQGAEQIWPLLEDFCNLHKWFPIDTSYQVDGVPGQPGLTRYCAFTVTSSSGGRDETATNWATEKLLTIDPIQRYLSYEIVDNNLGFKSYVAAFKVLPIDGDGCKIEWSFVCDPVDGWRYEDLVGYVDSCLKHMAEKMEHALQSSAG